MKLKTRNFWLMLLLTFLTCGIYGIVFYWTMIDDMNTLTKGEAEKLAPYWKLILFNILTCGIYSFVWYYKAGENQRLNGEYYNVSIGEGGSFHLIMMALGYVTCGITSIISSYIMVRNHNRLVEYYNSNKGVVIG